MLNQTILNTLLLQEANKAKIEVNEEEVDELLNGVELPEGQTLESLAQLQNFTVEELRTRIKEQMMIQKFLNNSVEVDVTEEEVVDYFNNNKDLFNQKLSVNASHILVNSSKEAYEILDEIKKGKKFEDMAKERSTDVSTKDKGGNLGVFPKGAMVKEFEDAAFDLDEGGVSQPIKTSFGFHIIKVNERIEEKEATLELSREKVEGSVRREKLNTAALDFIMNLYEKANIKIYLKEET